MRRTATAVWQGSGKDGKGNLSTQSSVLNETQYSFSSRFENGIGTNPEELVSSDGRQRMEISERVRTSPFAPDRRRFRRANHSLLLYPFIIPEAPLSDGWTGALDHDGGWLSCVQPIIDSASSLFRPRRHARSCMRRGFFMRLDGPSTL